MHERLQQKQRQHPHLAASDSSTFDMIIHFKDNSRSSKKEVFFFFLHRNYADFSWSASFQILN